MSSAISSFSICNVPLSPSKANGGSISSLPISLKSPTKPKQFIVISMAGNDSKNSLDHLQRARQQPTQPRKRAVQPQGASPVVVWDRFPAARTVQQMVDTMERMMEDPIAYSNSNWVSVPAAESNGYRRGRTPWAIRESETSYKIRIDMPGMTRSDVKVWVEENLLVVQAEKVPKTSQEGQVNIVSHTDEAEDEWPAESYGKYNNKIALPENIEFEKIKAGVKDGVLYVTIPKAKATSKKIDINVQ